MTSRFKENIATVIKNDPATKGAIDAFFTNPGIHALWIHRISHFFYKRNFVVLAKIIMQIGRFLTNIEIHPGATIGRRLFIDHGAGVVIGETTKIGEDVIIFHGVTLGGTGKEIGNRHPIIEDGAFISSGVKVLGSITVGKGAKVGAGAVVLKSVPPGATVVGIPAQIVRMNGEKVDESEININELNQRMNKLEQKIEKSIKGE